MNKNTESNCSVDDTFQKYINGVTGPVFEGGICRPHGTVRHMVLALTMRVE